MRADRYGIKGVFANVFILINLVMIGQLFGILTLDRLDTITQIGYTVCLVTFIAFYFFLGIRQRNVSMLALIIFPILMIPLISSFQAHQISGQSYLFGFLAERSKYYAIAGILLVFSLEKSWITIEQIEKNFVRLALVLFAIILFFNFFIDPSKLTDTNLVQESMSRGYRYKINSTFTVMLFFYALFQLVNDKKRVYAFLLVALIFYILAFARSRSLFVAITVTAVIYFQRNQSLSSRIVYLIWAGVAGVAVLTVMQLIYPDVMGRNIELFVSGLNVFLGGEIIDASAGARLKEAAIAWEGIQKHYLLGNGFLSSQWEDGFSGVHRYFHASDIGLLGNVFLYGLVGTAFIYVPFVAAFRYRKHLRKNYDTFLLTCQYTMLYLFIHMFTAGISIKKIGVIIFVFSLIYYYRYLHPEVKDEKNPETDNS